MKKVLFMSEGVGMYTKGFKDKSEAVLAMRKEAEQERGLDPDYWEGHFSFDPEEITEDTVESDWYYQHRACGGETIGDSSCYFCGEECGAGGRKTFSFVAN